MNVKEMLDGLQDYIFGELAAGAGADPHIFERDTAAVLGATIVIGLLLAFLGWKIVRVWTALAGFAAGGALGICLSTLAGLGVYAVLIIGIAAAAAGAALGAWLYRAGVFLIVFWGAGSLLIQILDPGNWILLAVCLLAALIAAVLSIWNVMVLTILVTGIWGAVSAAAAVCKLIPGADGLVRTVLCIVFAAGGITVQLLLESRKQKKASLKKAEQIREEESAANDVERARAMIDGPDETGE